VWHNAAKFFPSRFFSAKIILPQCFPAKFFPPNLGDLTPKKLTKKMLYRSFNSEKEYFFKKVSREFNFKVFSRLILIGIYIVLQLIDWQKLTYLNFESFFSMFENVFSETWSFSELENYMGFMMI